MDGGARVLGPEPLNASEAATPKNLRPGYIPESMDMKTWLVSLRDCYATLQYGLLDYVVQHKARYRVLDPNQWAREVNLNPIMSTILDYVFLEKIGKEPFDFNAVIIPKLQDLRIPMDVGLPLVHEVVMYVMSTIGNIFPEMYFGPDVRISYEIVQGNDLWISTTKEPVD